MHANPVRVSPINPNNSDNPRNPWSFLGQEHKLMTNGHVANDCMHVIAPVPCMATEKHFCSCVPQFSRTSDFFPNALASSSALQRPALHCEVQGLGF